MDHIESIFNIKNIGKKFTSRQKKCYIFNADVRLTYSSVLLKACSLSTYIKI
jgi:hypothetical protein